MTSTPEPAGSPDSDEPTIRDATLDDAPAILEVIEAAYERWPPVEVSVTPLAHLRWKMSPPGGIPLHHTIVEVGERTAAVELRWVCHVLIGGGEYMAEIGADLAVHPDFRGRGLSRLIKDHQDARRRVQGLSGFSTLSAAAEVVHMNEPDMVTRPMTTWTQPFRPWSYAAVHAREGGIQQLMRASRRRWLTSSPVLNGSLRIEVLDRFDARTDEVWESARGAYDLIPFRDADYLNWRVRAGYRHQPAALAVLEGSRVLAYAIVGRTDDRGHLLDWLWRPGDEHVLPALLEAAADRLRASGAAGISCWLPTGHAAEAVLEQSGFARVGTQPILFGSRELSAGRPQFLEVYEDLDRPIHLTMSDFDFV